MRVHYTGVPSGLTPTMQKQIQARLTRIGKILDKKGEKEGHVILRDAGRSRQAEITVNHHHHAFAGKATAKDDFGALAAAIDKLEKQIIKEEGKWRSQNRTTSAAKNVEPAVIAEEVIVPPVRIHRSTVKNNRKPMTADEAVLTLTKKHNYLTFHDADSGNPSIIVRRMDGNFDLIELA